MISLCNFGPSGTDNRCITNTDTLSFVAIKYAKIRHYSIFTESFVLVNVLHTERILSVLGTIQQRHMVVFVNKPTINLLMYLHISVTTVLLLRNLQEM